jgi:hypothetical protein
MQKLVSIGWLAERLMATDCKSVVETLRWFKSSIIHFMISLYYCNKQIL